MPKVTGPGEAVKVVTVEFVDASPLRAARFVDALMRLYLERRQSWKTEEATHAETFVAGQVHGMKDALDDAERKLADYKKGSNVVVLSDEAKGLIEQLGKYEEQRVAARLKVAAFGQVQDLLKQEHAPIEQYLVGETDDPVLAGLSNSLAAAQQELRKLEERFTPDAPAVKEEQAQVDGQLKTIRDYVLGRSMRAQRQLDSLGQMIAQFEKKLRTVPGAEFDLAQLTRNAEVSEQDVFVPAGTPAASSGDQGGDHVAQSNPRCRRRSLPRGFTGARDPFDGRPAAGLAGQRRRSSWFGRWSAPTFQSEGELARELPQLAGEPVAAGAGVGPAERSRRRRPSARARVAPAAAAADRSIDVRAQLGVRRGLSPSAHQPLSRGWASLRRCC